MRILFISQYFYPETFKGNDIAFDWAKRGFDVTVIAGIPNYPQGSFFNGYGLFKRRKEIIDGVKIIRIPIVPRGKDNPLLLILNYFSYAIIASFYTIFLALFCRFDKIFVQQLSPVLISVPAIIFKKIQKKPLITWVLDLWPESLSSAGGIKNKLLLDFFTWFTKLEYKNSDRILMSSKRFEESILQKGNFKNKLIYFPNWAEDTYIAVQKTDSFFYKLPKGFKIVFAGNIGEAQDFDNIMRAALMLKNEKNIKFIIIGDGRKKQWVDNFVDENQLQDKVYVLGRYHLEAMPMFFQQADVMLVSLKADYIFTITAPAKIQAYMSSRKPILGMLNGEGADIINNSNCGYCVDAGNPIQLKDAIIKMSKLSKDELDGMGINGYNYYQDNFNKEVCLNNLFEIIKTIN